jgi:hypothetical protein
MTEMKECGPTLGVELSIASTQLEIFKGCLPIDTGVVTGSPGLWWLDMHDVRLSEPFFQETVDRFRLEHSEREARFTEFHLLPQLGKSFASSIRPSGFVFHSSRCGSTLLANAGRSISGSIVISEANAIDQLVARFITDNEPRDVKRAIYSALLKAVMSAFGQTMTGIERHLIVKFSCSSTSKLEQIARIWPDVPWVFVYRDPVETIVSNLKTMPAWLLDQDRRILSSVIDEPVSTVSEMDAAELCARAIGSFYATAKQLASYDCMLLNYEQLSIKTLLKVLDFFGIEPTAEEVNEIAVAAQFYSKDSTGRIFESDALRKRSQANDRICEMAAKWSYPQYVELENMRLQLEESHL